jgi:hypothetical protein
MKKRQMVCNTKKYFFTMVSCCCVYNGLFMLTSNRVIGK